MEIKLQKIDNINAVLTVDLKKADYEQQVEEGVKRFAKRGNMPGFRKGHYPLGLVKKQYGKEIKATEINDILEKAVEKYISDNNITLYTSVTVKDNGVNWDADDMTFEYEMSIIPEVDFDVKNAEVRYFDIEAEADGIDEVIERYRKQMGTLVPEEAIGEESEVVASFFNETANIDKKSSFVMGELSAEAKEMVKGKKVGDQMTINSQKLFGDAHELVHKLGVDHEVAHHLDVNVTVTIEEVNKRELAELNEELFKNMFPGEDVKTLEEAKAKIKSVQEDSYREHSDKQLYNDMYEYIGKNVKLEIPELFLRKMMEGAADQEKIEEEITDPKKRKDNEDYLKYQIVERNLIKKNDIDVKTDDIRNFVRAEFERYSRMYGYSFDLSEKRIDEIIKERFKDKDQMNRVIGDIIQEKLIKFYKDNAKLKVQKLGFNAFVKEMNKINGIEGDK